jgi:hypothetical protein
MRPTPPRPFAMVALLALSSLPGFALAADDEGAGKSAWIELIGPDGALDAFRGRHAGWEAVADTATNPEDPKRLVAKPGAGTGVVFNGPGGRAPNLVTTKDFGDVEVHLEFMVPKGSNSGIKLEGVYEIQIFDSYGVRTLTGSQCGGIYPRAELRPKYHHIDEGYAPRVNASRPPGEWQTLEITWRAPRVDADGKKAASARFVKVVLNGQVVQDDVEVPCPTGNNWKLAEKPTGPILLQGDHGPVAFRNVRVRPLGPKE